MASSFTIDGELVESTLKAELSDLDEDTMSYLKGMIVECDDPGQNGSEIVEMIAPFLESYGKRS